MGWWGGHEVGGAIMNQPFNGYHPTHRHLSPLGQYPPHIKPPSLGNNTPYGHHPPHSQPLLDGYNQPNGHNQLYGHT